jgi:hypothetical protein
MTLNEHFPEHFFSFLVGLVVIYFFLAGWEKGGGACYISKFQVQEIM